MGRPNQGWKLTRPGNRACFAVKFSHAGRRFELGTGESDETKAAARAAQIYASTVSGNRPARTRAPLALRAVGTVAQEWLTSVAQTLDQTTLDTYYGYTVKHFEPFFVHVEAITPERTKAYIQTRLASVLAKTVRKELGALRGLLTFAGGDGSALPEVAKRAVGTRHAKGRRAKAPLAPWEVYEILLRLPKAARTRYTLAYETGLRPATLAALCVPEHYARGRERLRLSADVDKARFAREVPLSDRARSILDSLAPDIGPILGPGTHRKALRRAAVPVIGADRARELHPYALRGNRLTHLCEASGNNLPGVQWLAGHKKMSTTAIYAQGTLRAAEDVLR